MKTYFDLFFKNYFILRRSSVFALHCSEPPISAQLLAFLRVFCMTEGKRSVAQLREGVGKNKSL